MEQSHQETGAAASPDSGQISLGETSGQLAAVLSAEEARLWHVVNINCVDFSAWTALVDETEKLAEDNVEKLRTVYDAFLARFPLCYDYWKRYADYEGHVTGVTKSLAVFERAVQAVPHSVEAWYDYCALAISTYEDPNPIRRLFNHGLEYVGTNYTSNTLWDLYIQFEESLQGWSFLAVIYTRILEHPIKEFDKYFHSLKALTIRRKLSEILTSEEALEYAQASLTEAEYLENYISVREEMYKKAKGYESKIIGFEIGITRSCFQIGDIDKEELDNWHKYLDFVEKNDDISKVSKLYERCVIVCANYSKFWIRYVQYMDDRKMVTLAINALDRGSWFLKDQAEIHLFSARFKEFHGDISGARAKYEYVYTEVCPGLLEAIVKHANLEHRLGDNYTACLVYEKAIIAERKKERRQPFQSLLVQYSRFLYMVHDLEKAREILSEFHGLVNITRATLESIIYQMSVFPCKKHVELIDSLVEKFLASKSSEVEGASAKDKEEISNRFLEFLDMFGDAQSIKKATTRHTTLFSSKKSFLSSKKRRADDAFMSDRDKLAKTGDGTQSVIGTDPNASNLSVWSATFSDLQAVSPATYDYGYSHQGPQSASQAAAYGAYPLTYSVREEVSSQHSQIARLKEELLCSREEANLYLEHCEKLIAQYGLLHGANAVLFSDFLLDEENALVETFKFTAGTICGSIPPDEAMCRCTSTGNMVLNGFFGHAEQYYEIDLCWGGNFELSDMVIVDGVLCRINKIPGAELNIHNLALDIVKWKSNLLEKFKITVQKGTELVEMYPPYFDDLIRLLDKPPAKFGFDERVRESYLSSIFASAASATPSARMMALINFWQFGKTVKDYPHNFNALFNNLVIPEWHKIFESDKLMETIFLKGVGRECNEAGFRVGPVYNEAGELTNAPSGTINYAGSLRHLFVHIVEQTKDPNYSATQHLKSHIECDMMIAYYHKDFLAKLLRIIQGHRHMHPLLEALWEFYISGRRCYQQNLLGS